MHMNRNMFAISIILHWEIKLRLTNIWFHIVRIRRPYDRLVFEIPYDHLIISIEYLDLWCVLKFCVPCIVLCAVFFKPGILYVVFAKLSQFSYLFCNLWHAKCTCEYLVLYPRNWCTKCSKHPDIGCCCHIGWTRHEEIEPIVCDHIKIFRSRSRLKHLCLTGFIPKSQLTSAVCSELKRVINVAVITVQYYACITNQAIGVLCWNKNTPI